MSRTLNDAVEYRKNGKYDEAHTALTDLLRTSPDDPQINYQMAWLYDVQGKESAAIPYYEHAIESGLRGDDLQGALLGLGSTYRCLGRYEEAAAILRKGIDTFPDAREFPVFLAMALYNIGDYTEAMKLLLQNLAETTQDVQISRYRKTILYYSDKLDNRWE